MKPTNGRPSSSRFAGTSRPSHLERRPRLFRQQPLDVPLRGSLRAPHLQLELDARSEIGAVAFERPLDVIAHSPAHRRAFGIARARKLSVKVLEREVKGGAVGRGRRSFILDGRASVAVKPLARALRVRVERRCAEVLLPPRNAGGFFPLDRLRPAQTLHPSHRDKLRRRATAEPLSQTPRRSPPITTRRSGRRAARERAGRATQNAGRSSRSGAGSASAPRSIASRRFPVREARVA